MEFRGTTICAVKRGGMTAIAGDGQVTMGESVIMKGNAVKVKRIYNDKVVIGFAGSVSDAFALSEKFEEMLQKYSGNLMRSAVELAELWRSDKMYRKLEALLIVADANSLYIVSGSRKHLSNPDAHGSGPQNRNFFLFSHKCCSPSFSGINTRRTCRRGRGRPC